MNNWFGLFNSLLAKKQLKDNGIKDTPPEILNADLVAENHILLSCIKDISQLVQTTLQLNETREVFKRRITETDNVVLVQQKAELKFENDTLVEGLNDVLQFVQTSKATSVDELKNTLQKYLKDNTDTSPGSASLSRD